MRFRTEAELPATDWRINHSTPVMLSGSCFSDRIGERLLADKFNVLANPLGVVYHPIPLISSLLEAVSGNVEGLLQRTFEHEGIWRNHNLTGEFAGLTREDAEARIRKACGGAKDFFSRTNLLVLTFGTAWGYVLKDDGEIVANCHKLPQQRFEKKLFSPEEIAAAITPMLQTLQLQRPGLRILLTVSPVRHIRDGIANDRLSKSVLRLLCHQLAQALPDTLYFPSYELVTDDLRDYRFFESDLMHPNSLATEYVYERFSKCFFESATMDLLDRWRAIRRELEHRPQFPGSANHLQFLMGLCSKLEAISNELEVTQEIEQVRAQLDALQQ